MIHLFETASVVILFISIVSFAYIGFLGIYTHSIAVLVGLFSGLKLSSYIYSQLKSILGESTTVLIATKVITALLCASFLSLIIEILLDIVRKVMGRLRIIDVALGGLTGLFVGVVSINYLENIKPEDIKNVYTLNWIIEPSKQIDASYGISEGSMALIKGISLTFYDEFKQ